jgi:uncharacterized spore protein YtfJ
MDEKLGVEFTKINNQEEGMRLMNRLVDITRPNAIFAEPVTVGEYTLITTTEIASGLGYGFGYGMGPVEAGEHPEETSAAPADQVAGGGGGGGGGYSAGRPVAVITVGPDGVKVEPVVDVTKIGLAVFTTLASLVLVMSRMRRYARR